MKAMKLSAMKQSTKKRPSAAVAAQRDLAMKEARTSLVRAYKVRAHQRQLRDPDRSSFIAAQERTYSEVCGDLHRVDLHGSHKIMLYRGIWFCASCWAYTHGLRKHAVRKLCRPCKPAGRGGQMRLRKLALGKHPNLKPWPAELNGRRHCSASGVGARPARSWTRLLASLSSLDEPVLAGCGQHPQMRRHHPLGRSRSRHTKKCLDRSQHIQKCLEHLKCRGRG